MNRIFYPHKHGYLTSIGILFVRVVTGAAFIFHGWPKIQKPLNWMGENADMPAALQAAAAVAEFGGGILLIPGLITAVSSLLLAVTMAVATYVVHISSGHPFVAAGKPSYELSLVYLSITVLLLLAGPGMFSLDRVIFGGGGGKKS